MGKICPHPWCKKSLLIMAVGVGGTEKGRHLKELSGIMYLDRVVGYRGTSLINASNCNISM